MALHKKYKNPQSYWLLVDCNHIDWWPVTDLEIKTVLTDHIFFNDVFLDMSINFPVHSSRNLEKPRTFCVNQSKRFPFHVQSWFYPMVYKKNNIILILQLMIFPSQAIQHICNLWKNVTIGGNSRVKDITILRKVEIRMYGGLSTARPCLSSLISNEWRGRNLLQRRL